MKHVHLPRAGLAVLAVVWMVGVHAERRAWTANGCAGNCPAATVQVAPPPADLADTKCLTVTNPYNASVNWKLRLNTTGSEIDSGTVTGTLCGKFWSVTGGTLTKSTIDLTAQCVDAKACEGCASLLTMDGTQSGHKTYSGNYFWNDDPEAHFFDARRHACK